MIKSFGKEAALWHSIPSTGISGTGQSALSIIFPQVPCFYSMTVDLDVTELKRRGGRLYPAVLFTAWQ